MYCILYMFTRYTKYFNLCILLCTPAPTQVPWYPTVFTGVPVHVYRYTFVYRVLNRLHKSVYRYTFVYRVPIIVHPNLNPAVLPRIYRRGLVAVTRTRDASPRPERGWLPESSLLAWLFAPPPPRCAAAAGILQRAGGARRSVYRGSNRFRRERSNLKNPYREASRSDSREPFNPLDAYLRLLERHPLPTKALTSMLIVGVGDIGCQVVLGEEGAKFDWKRFMTFTFLGGALSSVLHSTLVRFLEQDCTGCWDCGCPQATHD